MTSWGYAVISLACLMIMFQKWWLGFILLVFGITIVLKGKKVDQKYGNKKDD